MPFSFEAIGRVRSCFPEKFGIPRQPGLVPEAEAVIEITPPYNQSQAFKGLDQFSHIWILFVFHQCYRKKWHHTVRPPRLGGNQRVGVFASRSGFRPNAIGQSVVKLLDIAPAGAGLGLRVEGADLMDGTPVLDIKPYIVYSDSVPQAESGYAPVPPPEEYAVHFSNQAEQACAELDPDRYPKVKRLITGLLAQDPRPAYKTEESPRIYGMRLWDLNIRFQFRDRIILVLDITPYQSRRRIPE